jgi:hypothetical protein
MYQLIFDLVLYISTRNLTLLNYYFDHWMFSSCFFLYYIPQSPIVISSLWFLLIILSVWRWSCVLFNRCTASIQRDTYFKRRPIKDNATPACNVLFLLTSVYNLAHASSCFNYGSLHNTAFGLCGFCLTWLRDITADFVCIWLQRVSTGWTCI